MEKIKETIFLMPEHNGQRLDVVLSKILATYSRNVIQKWISKGELLVNGKLAKSKQLVIGNETITINAEIEAVTTWDAEDINIDIVAEDEDFLVIDKPFGMVVHPAAGNYSQTLVNALLFKFPDLEHLPRAGIVHRLDKDTSGLLVVARNLQAHASLVRQLQARTVHREYEAIVNGRMIAGGLVNAPIGRSYNNRQKMAICEEGKYAVTNYRIIKRFTKHTHLQLKLETGRTHQIRVHMASINHALVGDKLYSGNRVFLPKNCSLELKQALQNFPRQALHSCKLSFKHPITENECIFTSPLPEDMQHLLHLLAQEEAENDRS